MSMSIFMYYLNNITALFIVYFCVLYQFTFRLLSCIIVSTNEHNQISNTGGKQHDGYKKVRYDFFHDF